MKGFLLDTNVISELRRPRPNPNVAAFITTQPERLLFLSEITFAEIRFGIEKIDDPIRRAELSDWLNRQLRPLFEGRVLAIDEETILRWRIMLEVGRRAGHTFGQPDLFIAALAAEHDLVVISRDTTHFVAAGVVVFDPWTLRLFRMDGETRTFASVNQPDLVDALTSRQ